jgi:hypothetical protein
MEGAFLTFIGKHLVVSLTVLITVIPIVFIGYKKAYVDPSFLLLWVYLFVKLIIDLMTFHYTSERTNHLILYNINIPIRYALLSGMYYYKLEGKSYKRGVLYGMAGFIIFSIWDIFSSNTDIKDLHHHQIVPYAFTLECLLMLFWILLYFYEIIRMLKIPDLLTFPFFWVCSGLLLYYSSSIFIAPLLHYTEKWNNQSDIWFLDQVPYIFETVCLISFSVGVSFFSARYYAKQ